MALELIRSVSSLGVGRVPTRVNFKFILKWQIETLLSFVRHLII